MLWLGTIDYLHRGRALSAIDSNFSTDGHIIISDGMSISTIFSTYKPLVNPPSRHFDEGKILQAFINTKGKRDNGTAPWILDFAVVKLGAGGGVFLKRVPDEKCASICGLFCGACPSFPEECHGCLSDYVRKGCKNCADHGFLECAINHAVSRCYECGEFPCEKLKEFSTKPIINGICNHANVIPDSLRMREAGVSQWVGEKIKEHMCPKCGRLISWFEMNSHVCG